MTDMNHAEVIRKALEALSEVEANSGCNDDDLSDDALAALDALTREADSLRMFRDLYNAAADGRVFEEQAATIAAQSARIATLEEALAVAKDAMDERRSYVNGGDPSGCWQEMKYGKAWDAEDAKVSAALDAWEKL